MKFKKLLSAVAATAIAASAFAGMAVTASAETTTVTYALAVGDTFTSGQDVDVKNGDTTVATITYGEAGGANFNAAANDTHVEGYVASTGGNGTNGNKTGGTFYTITPVYAGTINVAVVLNADKPFYIEEDGKALSDYNGITVSAKYYGTYSFKVKAGSSYKVYCAGSKLGFYGFEYTYGTSSGEPGEDPQPDPEHTVTFSKGLDSAVTGEVPASQTTTGSVTIPANRTLYKEGYTLTGWTDGTNTYAIGNSFTPASDTTLTPVFTQNTAAPSGSVAFDFRRQSGAPSYTKQNVTGFYVGQSTNGVDVKIDFDTNPGKIDNSAWTNCVQLNSGTTFTIPVLSGTTVTVGKGYTNDSSKTICTINGEAIMGSGAETYSKVIDSDTDAIIVIGDDSYYYNETIVITYPVPPVPTELVAVSQDTTWNCTSYAKNDKYRNTTVFLAEYTLKCVATDKSDAIKVTEGGIVVRTDSSVSINPSVPGTVKVTSSDNFIINNIEYTSDSSVEVPAGEVVITLKTDKAVITSITFTPAQEEETKEQYFSFEGEEGLTCDKLYVHAIKGELTAETEYTMQTAVTLTGGSLALMIEDIPADVTIDKVELR